MRNVEFLISDYMQFAFLHMGNIISICANNENAAMLMLEPALAITTKYILGWWKCQLSDK